MKTRKCYSIGESEGEFYIDGFVLQKFIESVRLALNELAQYKTALCRTRLRSPNAVTFSSYCILKCQAPGSMALHPLRSLRMPPTYCVKKLSEAKWAPYGANCIYSLAEWAPYGANCTYSLAECGSIWCKLYLLIG